MATSSIFTTFEIKDREKAEAFVKALVESEKESKNEIITPAPLVTDPEAIKEFFKKREIALKKEA